MNKFIILTVFIFLSPMALAMETIRPWFRVNEVERHFEVSFRTYINKETKKSIMLLSMSHVALEDFYLKVNELITGKTVLYELNGHEWEQVRRQQEAIRLLDEVYKKRLELSGMDPYRLLASHHGISCQIDCLNYELALELFHADLQSETKVDHVSQSDLKDMIDTLIEQRYRDLADHFDIPYEENIDKKAGAIFLELKKQLPDLKGLIVLLTNSMNSLDHHKHYIQDRNAILEQRTLELLPHHDELVITYGGAHFPDFEMFLLKHGFQMQDEKWMKVFQF